jgi:hypothetical protein
MRRITRLASTLHVRELRRYFAVLHGEDVDSPQVPGLTIAHLVIDPQHRRSIAAHNDFFGFEARVRIPIEPRSPKLDDLVLSFNPSAVRSGRGVLEYCVFGQTSR